MEKKKREDEGVGGCEDPLLWDPGELLSVSHSDTLPGLDEGLSAAPFCCCDITPAHQQQYTLIAVIFFFFFGFAFGAVEASVYKVGGGCS